MLIPVFGIIGIALWAIPIIAGALGQTLKSTGGDPIWSKICLGLLLASISNIPIGLISLDLLVRTWPHLSQLQQVINVAAVLANLGIGAWWILWFYPKSKHL
jgi:hypothetical protein